MPQLTCPNCQSEDLEAYEMSHVVQYGATIYGCDYCIEKGLIVAGDAHMTALDRAMRTALERAGEPAVYVTAQQLARSLEFQLKGWTVGPANDGSVEAGLYHSCQPEPVRWVDGEEIGRVLDSMLSHYCGASE